MIIFKVRLINSLNPELHNHNRIMDIKHKGVINTNILKKNMSHVVRLSVTILFVIISAIRPATTMV